jgi:hypothetical protein
MGEDSEMIRQETRLERAIAINDDLMDHLDATIRWLLHYCKKHNIEPPNLEQIKGSVLAAQIYLNNLPTFSAQPQANTLRSDGTNVFVLLNLRAFKMGVGFWVF